MTDTGNDRPLPSRRAGLAARPGGDTGAAGAGAPFLAPRLALVVALVVAVALALAACSHRSDDRPLETASIAHGPFEIVAKGRRISTGAFPNTSGNPFATMEVTGFTVRHQGQPVSFQHGARTMAGFWRVVRLTDAPVPTLLASTTDFHLLSDDGGRLVTRSFGEPSTNMADYQWLDADRGQPTPPRSFGIQKVDPDAGTELGGGRWLRLSAHTVLDVTTLRSYPIRPWIPSGTRRPMAGLNAGNVRAIAFSPGQTQYVTIGSGYDYERDGEHYQALLVVDIPSGEAYGHRLERRLTHFIDIDDATPEWLARHFRWTKDAQGRERLEPRPGVKPAPWVGRVIDTGGGPNYRLRPTQPGMEATLVRFIVERMQGRPAPDPVDPKRPSDRTLAVPGCDDTVVVYHHDAQTVLYTTGPTNRVRADCSGTVRRIADAFNTELARGRYQSQFTDD